MTGTAFPPVLDRLERVWELRGGDVHTCNPDCLNPLCVLGRLEREYRSLSASYADGLAAWKANSAYHAQRIDTLTEALQLIAAGPRSDGTWNRDREACRLLASRALAP